MIFKEHKKDITALSALTIFLIITTLLLLDFDGKMGAYYARDVFFYLNSALYYAGYPTGIDTSRGLSPLIPFITAVFFKMGFISDKTLMAVSSLFYILSGIGMYFLLRIRFKELMSFTGSMILSTFPLMIVWATKGMIDIPGLCFAIWAVYFTVLAFEKNIKFLYIAFPIGILGFFSRYTVLLMAPVVLIQFLLVKKPFSFIKDNIKHIIGAVASAILTFAIFIGIGKLLNMEFYFMRQGSGIAQATHSTLDLHYNNIYYYIQNLPIYLGGDKFIPYSLKPGAFSLSHMRWLGGQPSIIGYLLFFILIVGIVLYLAKLLNAENRQLMSGNHAKIKFLIFAVTFVVFLLTLIKISVVLSLIIISISLFALYKIVDKSNIEHLRLDFIMLFWFAINLTFYTYHHVNVDRYFISMLPPLAYFITVSLELIFEKLENLKNIDKIKVIAPIALICLILLCMGVNAVSNYPHTFDNQMPENIMTASAEEKAVGNWLIEHDPQYANKTIWADRGGDMSFILKMNVAACEKISQLDNFTDEMVKENVSYFIAKDNKTINEPFTQIYQNGEVRLYYNENEQ